MVRFLHVLVGATYVLAGVVAAAALTRLAGWPGSTAAVAAGVTALIGAVTHIHVVNRAAHRSVHAALMSLRRANLLLVEELTAARNRAEALETQIDIVRAEQDRAIRAESERVDTAILNLRRRIAIAPSDEIGPLDPRALDSDVRPLPAETGEILDAIAAGRADLWVQPIVRLPQRRPVFYEVFTHLRTAEGQTLTPAAWLPAAEREGAMSQVDALTAKRCLRLARRFADEARRAGLFCNLSVDVLEDSERFKHFLLALQGDTDMADAVVFELRQAAFRELSLLGHRHLRRLADFGFRFSLDHVSDVDFDVSALRAAGVRFVKIQGADLVDLLREGGPLGLSAGPHLHVEDLPALLSRNGVDIIAEKVEDEAVIIEALDYDVSWGQGHLFGAPRTVKPGALAAA